MKASTVQQLVEGFKKAGINFLVWLPSQSIAPLIEAVREDPYFTSVPISHEGMGIGVCAGAWLGGKKPALLMQNSGFCLCSYSLMGVLRLGGYPMLLVIDHRGDVGDDKARWLFGWAQNTPEILDMLRLPYKNVSNDFTAEVVRCWKTTEAYGKPSAILLVGDEVYGD